MNIVLSNNYMHEEVACVLIRNLLSVPFLFSASGKRILTDTLAWLLICELSSSGVFGELKPNGSSARWQEVSSADARMVGQ